MEKGLQATKSFWPALAKAYAWLERAAKILANEAENSGRAVRRRYRRLLAELKEWLTRNRSHRAAFQHFLKVTQSYWPGLFACYDVPGLPRTNSDLEHFFGTHRYHERRASGRKGGAPGTVVNGSARLLAAAATRLGPSTAEELAPREVSAWRELRAQIQRRRQVRTLGRRFRRSPAAYLSALEERLKSALPP